MNLRRKYFPEYLQAIGFPTELCDICCSYTRRAVSVANVELICTILQRSPRMLIRRSSRELQLPRSTVHDAVHKRLAYGPISCSFVTKSNLRTSHDGEHSRKEYWRKLMKTRHSSVCSVSRTRLHSKLLRR